MAGFSENSPIQFSQYIPEINNDLALKVGMAKQQQYEQGIQRIQSTIDNVAGLDVYRDVDKQYLQSKLNELGNNLKWVGAGDFSDFQLVNSVNGMTNQLAKDQNVLNAVSSTAKVKKGFADMEAAKKDGKSSPDNDWFYSQQVHNYANDKNLKASFNGQYVEYTDINKKLRDIADKIHEYDNTIDIPYKRIGNSMELQRDANGNPIVDQAMLELNTKGKSASKLFSTFKDSLDEKDIQQLRISSAYHFKDKTRDDFINDINNKYESTIKNTQNKINDVALEIATNKNLTKSEIARLSASVKDANDYLKSGEIEKLKYKELEQLNSVSDLDSLKFQLYTHQTLDNLSKDLAYEDIKKTLKENPYQQEIDKSKELQFKYDKLNQDAKEFKLSYFQKERELDLKDPNKNTTPKLTVSGAISTEVNPLTLGDINKNLNSLEGEYSKNGELITPGEKQKLDEKYLHSVVPQEIINQGGKAIDKYYNGLYNKFLVNPSILESKNTDKNTKEYLRNRLDLERRIDTQKGILNSVNSDKEILQANKEVKQYIGKLKGVLDASGTKELVTAEDLYTMKNEFGNSLSKQISTALPSVGGVVPVPQSFDKFSKTSPFDDFINKYKGTSKEGIARAFVNDYFGQKISLNAKVAINRANEIYSMVAPKAKEASKKIEEKTSEIVNKLSPERQYKERGLTYKPNASANDPSYHDTEMVRQILSLAKSNQLELGGPDTQKSSQGNIETLNKLLSTPGTTFTLRNKYSDGSGELYITNDKKDSQQVIKIPASMLNEAFPNYVKKNILDDALTKIRTSADKCSGPTNRTDRGAEAVKAFFSGNDIPGLRNTQFQDNVRINIIGHPSNDGNSANDTYCLRLYRYDGNSWKYADTNEWINEAGIKVALQNIGTKTVSQIK